MEFDELGLVDKRVFHNKNIGNLNVAETIKSLCYNTGAKKFYKKVMVDLGADIPVVSKKKVDIFHDNEWIEEEW